jgi:hypothetical protein
MRILQIQIRGVLGNKCAGQHNLKTVHFREKLASSNFLAWLSAVCVFFCSALSNLGLRAAGVKYGEKQSWENILTPFSTASY